MLDILELIYVRSVPLFGIIYNCLSTLDLRGSVTSSSDIFPSSISLKFTDIPSYPIWCRLNWLRMWRWVLQFLLYRLNLSHRDVPHGFEFRKFLKNWFRVLLYSYDIFNSFIQLVLVRIFTWFMYLCCAGWPYQHSYTIDQDLCLLFYLPNFRSFDFRFRKVRQAFYSALFFNYVVSLSKALVIILKIFVIETFRFRSP